MVVVRQPPGAHVERVQVGHVADAVDVAAFPYAPAVGCGQRDVQPDLRLRAERTRRQIVPRIGIGDAIREFETAAGLWLPTEERPVDARAVLHHLPALFLLLRDLLQVRGDDAPGCRAVARVGPFRRELDLAPAGAQVTLELLAAPIGAVI